MNQCIICQEPAANRVCGKKSCRSEVSRRTIANTFKKHGGQITQFRKTNGMHRPEVRALVSTKLRAMGWGPVVRCGNGKPLPIHQQALAAALGWEMEVVIKTGKPRESGYPTCYKVDIGNVDLKVGVEVDGFSHCALTRRDQDKKKEELLSSFGWLVLRFTNLEVESNLAGCVQKVLSIISKSPTETPL